MSVEGSPKRELTKEEEAYCRRLGEIGRSGMSPPEMNKAFNVMYPVLWTATMEIKGGIVVNYSERTIDSSAALSSTVTGKP